MGDCVLKINAPNLVSLNYESNFAKDYILSTFAALVEADFQFFLTGYETMEQKVTQNAAVSKLFGALSQVKCLSIINPHNEVLAVSDDLLNKLPTFHKLNRLVLYHVMGDKTVIDLLKASPNLEYLEFCLFLDGDDYSDGGIEGFHTSFPHLKEVCFVQHFGHPRELRWMKLILKNAVASQRMNIGNCLKGLERRQEFMEEISNVPRASSVCVASSVLRNSAIDKAFLKIVQ